MKNEMDSFYGCRIFLVLAHFHFEFGILKKLFVFNSNCYSREKKILGFKFSSKEKFNGIECFTLFFSFPFFYKLTESDFIRVSTHFSRLVDKK